MNLHKTTMEWLCLLSLSTYCLTVHKGTVPKDFLMMKRVGGGYTCDVVSAL